MSADGSTAVSGSGDQTVRVWDLRTGQCRSTLTGHSHKVYGVAVSADGSTAVSGSYDNTVRVWPLEAPDGIDVSKVEERGLADLEETLGLARSQLEGIRITAGVDEEMAALQRRREDIEKTYEQEKAELERRLEALKARMEEDVKRCEAGMAELEASVAKEQGERRRRDRLVDKVGVLEAQIEKLRKATERVKTLYADALEMANEVIDEDTLRYNTAYSRYLRTAEHVKSRDALDSAIGAYALGASFVSEDRICWKREGVGELLQPDGGGLMEAQEGSLTEEQAERREQYAEVVRNALRPVVEKLEGPFRELASRVEGVTYERGPAKGNARLFQKARMSYKGNLRRVTDFERCSFVCVDFGAMAAVFEGLTGVVETMRIKNRFSKSNKEATESGGYRDLQVVARVAGGLLLEIQVHLTTFHELKTMVAEDTDQDGQTGHQRYVQFRQLKEKAEFTRQNYLSKLRK